MEGGGGIGKFCRNSQTKGEGVGGGGRGGGYRFESG